MNTFKSILTAWALLLLPAIFVTCDDDKEEITIPPENSIPGQEVGIRQLSLKVPRLGRLEVLFSRVNCRIHLKGIGDRVTYPINTFLSADADTLLVEAEDPILSELPHQQYYLNYITFPKKDLTVKAETDETAKTAESAIVQDTIYLGARLSIEDPNNIAFRSSFNKKDNCIGSGKEDDPINIACGLDFKTLVADALTKGDDLKDKVINLTENINLMIKDVNDRKGWEPAGHSSIKGGYTNFNGTLNGNGNFIEDLFCHTSDGSGGLFYSLGKYAYIHDIQFKNVALDGGDYLGAVACRSDAGSHLENISVDGYISGKNYIGGLVGEGGIRATRCISSLTVHAKAPCNYVGGMVGYGEDGFFTDCMRKGLIDAPLGNNVGGFVGASLQTKFTRCYVSGTIKGGNMTGGFCGNNEKMNILDSQAGVTILHDSYAYPWDDLSKARIVETSLDIQGNDYVGGFLGYGKLTLTGKKCVFTYKNVSTPSLTGNNYVGGLAGAIKEFQVDQDSEFTSYAYITGNNYVGGIIGEFIQAKHNVSTILLRKGALINEGTIRGKDYVGGIFGFCEILKEREDRDYSFSLTNTASIHGHSYVGGIVGRMNSSEIVTMINDGDVIADGDYVGGLFGIIGKVKLDFPSRLSKEGGSLKIKGANHVGGFAGRTTEYFNRYPRIYANIIGKSNVGGLCGSVELNNVDGTGYLVNGFYGQISITSESGDNVGGVIGLLQVHSKNPKNSTVGVIGVKELSGSITANGNGVGGIVGRAENYNCVSLYISGCDNHMNITSTSSTNVEGYGGILGVRYEPGSPIEITGCSNQSNIYGPVLSGVGGIAGQIKKSIYVEQCYNAGTIDGTSAVGGIIGRAFGLARVTDCFNMGPVPWASHKSLLAGIVGQKENKNSEDLLLKHCYNIGETGWGIIGGEKGALLSRSGCYYLNTASDGDMKGTGSWTKTADEMRRKETFSGFSTNLWEFPSDGVGAPYLKYVTKPNPLPLQK